MDDHKWYECEKVPFVAQASPRLVGPR
jgi:hypothetical protein